MRTLEPRLAPCLLVKGGAVVKTVGFGSERYVGDPLNAVRIFNEKQVDELIIVDIGVSLEGVEPDYALLSRCAGECQMPLAYVGGVSRLDQIEKLIGLGIEKVGLGRVAANDPGLVSKAASRVGRQSIVAVVDVKKRDGSAGYEVCVDRGQRGTGWDPVDFALAMEKAGAGEILLQSIDRDGTGLGYDLELIAGVRGTVGIPITVLGGAGSLKDIEMVYAKFGVIGAAAGSLFVFRGKYRAVLISYPSLEEKAALIDRALNQA